MCSNLAYHQLAELSHFFFVTSLSFFSFFFARVYVGGGVERGLFDFRISSINVCASRFVFCSIWVITVCKGLCRAWIWLEMKSHSSIIPTVYGIWMLHGWMHMASYFIFLCKLCINLGKQHRLQPHVCLIKSKFSTFPLIQIHCNLLLGFCLSTSTFRSPSNCRLSVVWLSVNWSRFFIFSRTTLPIPTKEPNKAIVGEVD